MNSCFSNGSSLQVSKERGSRNIHSTELQGEFCRSTTGQSAKFLEWLWPRSNP